METAVTQASKRLIEASLEKSETVLSQHNTSMKGLSSTEARHRLQKYGKIEIAHEKSPAWYCQLLSAFFDPFIGILIILAAASFLTGYVFAPPTERDLTALIIISIFIFISVILTFIQDYQASQAAEKLLSMVQNTAMVERSDTGKNKLPTNEIISGDINHLAAGDIIPAEVPFTTERRRVSVIVDNGQGVHLMICKGAIDEILSISTKAEKDGEISLLTSELQKDFQKRANDLMEGGLRVLLVAYKPVDPSRVGCVVGRRSRPTTHPNSLAR